MKPDARQATLFAARPTGLFLVAVRVDGRRSHVETFADFDAMMEAGKQWLCNSEIAWASFNIFGRPPRQTHILTRDKSGDGTILTEHDGRSNRVGRGRERKSVLTSPV